MAGWWKGCGTCLTRICQIAILILIITFAPGLPPDMDFEPYVLNVPPLQGPLSVNEKLNNAERLFENNVKGPEDLAVYNNELYTTCHGGIVSKIANGQLQPVLKTGKACDGFYQEHICGRPLGLKFDKNGLLYIADAYYGILKSNLTTGKIETLVNMFDEIDGKRPMIPNSLVVSHDVIYWTDSSTTHNLFDGIYTFLGNGRGRVLKYTISKKQNEVLVKNIHFANGILLSNDGNFLIIAETFRARLLRYYIGGAKAGTLDVFVDNLPGFPDNLHKFGDKNIVASLVLPVDSMTVHLASAPYVRKFLARFLTIIESTFKFINGQFGNILFEKTIHWLGHFEMLDSLKPVTSGHTISVVIDNNGRIVESLHAPDKKVSSISALMKFNNYYFLASPFNQYLGRVKT